MQSIIKKVTCVILFTITGLTYAAGQPLLITGDLIDDSKYDWSPNFLLVYPDGCSHEIRFNIAPSGVPTTGRFMIPITPGETDHISMVTTGSLPFDMDLCDFTFYVDGDNHVSFQQTSENQQAPVLCQYSGDPNNNTAQILLIDNPSPTK